MLGRTGFKVSDIGCDYPGTASESVLKAAIAGGVNFIDSIEGHGSGNSEVTIGRAIKNCPRESLFINSKIAVTDKDTRETLVSRVRKSLERLDTPYIDGLMLWSANTVKATENKVFHSAVKKMRKEGLGRPDAGNCAGCEGFCETACPYGVPIHALLEDAHKNMSLA